MRIIGTGTDIVPVERIASLLAERGQRFVERWFTPAETAYCLAKSDAAQHLAARLAAKEAVFKALRLSGDRAVPYRDIEIGHEPGGAPVVHLHGVTALDAAASGVAGVHVSLAHVPEYATATALAFADQ